MTDIDHKKLTKEINLLRIEMSRLTNRYSFLYLFVAGLLHGVGILVGATLLVLVGSVLLNLLGLLPGIEDVIKIIIDAFERAKL